MNVLQLLIRLGVFQQIKLHLRGLTMEWKDFSWVQMYTDGLPRYMLQKGYYLFPLLR